MLRLLLRPPVLCRALAVAVLVCAGCGRIGYDLLTEIDGGGSPGTGGAAGASLTGSGGSSGMAGGPGGALGSMDGPPPNTTCTQAGTPTQLWSFDTDLQGWMLSGPGSMVWNGAVGDPGLGAAEVDWTGTTFPRLVQAFGDLRGHIITAEVWVDAGTNVTTKLFVQTGTRSVWADGGVVSPTPGQWTCLALDINNPAFSRQQYDPTNVAVLGIQLDGSGASRVYFDEIAY